MGLRFATRLRVKYSKFAYIEPLKLLLNMSRKKVKKIKLYTNSSHTSSFFHVCISSPSLTCYIKMTTERMRVHNTLSKSSPTKLLICNASVPLPFTLSTLGRVGSEGSALPFPRLLQGRERGGRCHAVCVQTMQCSKARHVHIATHR